MAFLEFLEVVDIIKLTERERLAKGFPMTFGGVIVTTPPLYHYHISELPAANQVLGLASSIALGPTKATNQHLRLAIPEMSGLSTEVVSP